jgi:hypothetical protein
MAMSLSGAAIALSQALRWAVDARRFEAATRDPGTAQRERLRAILHRNRDTEYGRAHGFGAIESVAEYQRNVPVNSYETLGPLIERMASGEHEVLTSEDPMMFAVTSGTTGKQKLIPVTPAFLAECNHAIQVHTWRILEDHPGAVAGKLLVTSSCDVEGRTSAGIPFGALSGFVVKHQPLRVRRHFVLPYEIALIHDIAQKYYLTLRLAVATSVTAVSTLNPSSIILLCDKLQEHAERLIAEIRAGTANGCGHLDPPLDRALRPYLKPNPRRADELQSLLRQSGELHPRAVWPELKAVSHWKGGTMSLYTRQLRRWFGDLPTRDRGYMASEGVGSIPLVDAGAAGALAVTTHFFEFIPVERREDPHPPILTTEDLQPNREYYVLFTTSGGLYRYDINDIVRVVDYFHDVPMIEFVRKGRGITNLTGEKLAEPQVTTAMMRALDDLRFHDVVRHFTAVPKFGAPPRYVVFIEASDALGQEQAIALAGAFDKHLYAANVEYETKRDSLRLGPPLIRLVAPGTYNAYRQQRVAAGAPEAQVKVPHLTPEMEFGRDFQVTAEVG